MAGMNNTTPTSGGITPRTRNGDRVKARLSFAFGITAVLTGGTCVLIDMISLLLQEGIWVFLNPLPIAGLALSITGIVLGGRVSSKAEEAVLRKAAGGKRLSAVGMVINIIATILLFLALVFLFSLMANGDHILDYKM